ncbi:unnamed protein product, partial [Mesorhabditis spiculigera]
MPAIMEPTDQPVYELELEDLLKRDYVLVTFGSLARVSYMTRKHFHEMVSAFEVLPYPVIWQADFTSIRKFEGIKIPQNVRFAAWLPVKRMLGTSTLKFIISHGGVNTLNEMLQMGVTGILMPLQGDQGSNARRLHDLGVVDYVKPHHIKRDVFAVQLSNFLLKLERMQARAAKVSDMLHKHGRLMQNSQSFWFQWALRHGSKDGVKKLMGVGQLHDWTPFSQHSVVPVFFGVLLLALRCTMPPLAKRGKKAHVVGVTNPITYEDAIDPLMAALSQIAAKEKLIPPLLENFSNSMYFRAMFDVLCDRKNENALQAHVFHFMKEEETDSQVDLMLERYFSQAEHGGPCDAEDETSRPAHLDIEEDYKFQMAALKSTFEGSKSELQEECDKLKKKVADTLELQKAFRPVTEEDKRKAMDAIEDRFQKAENQVKQVTCNQALILSNSCLDARRKRRNFSKEAIAILQDFFVTHANHPYPTDEEKADLAKKCNITVQQVSNWFGNRRIRQKKVMPAQMKHYANMLQVPYVIGQQGGVPKIEATFLQLQQPSSSQLPGLQPFLHDPQNNPDTTHQLSCVYGTSMANLYP